VLLSLGVSYTNELDQGRALNYFNTWLLQQPAFAQARIISVMDPFNTP